VLKVVGETVRRLRLKRSWSQDFLADQTGLHRAHVGEIERGESNVTMRLKIIADALGVRIVDLWKRAYPPIGKRHQWPSYLRR